MLRISILDDDPYFLDIINSKVSSLLFPKNIDYKIKVFNDYSQFLEYSSTEKTDLLLLDIDMPNCNGIAFSKSIYVAYPDCIIIFMTSHSKYMKDAFNLNIFAFIEKSELEKRLNNTIDLFINEYINVNQIKISTPEGDIFLYEKEIFFFEKVNRKIYLQTKDRYIQIYYQNLKDVYKLVRNKKFAYANQSCIVNFDWIYKIKNNEINFKGMEKQQFISRRMKVEFDLAFLEYRD